MIKEAIGKSVIEIFSRLTPDLNGIYQSAHTYSLDGWIAFQAGLVTGSGALTVVIPGLHLLGMAADVAFLMNRMSVCCYGVGSVLGYQNNQGSILESEDFAVVLARWSGDDSLSNAAVTKTAVSAAGKIGGKAATKLLAQIAASNAGILVGKKLGAKTSAKIAGKFAAKLGTKSLGGFIPFIGPAIGGGINLWFITSIAGEAEKWYRFKLSLRDVDATGSC